MRRIKKIVTVMSTAVMLLVCASGVQAQSFINETFMDTTAPDWTFVNAAGDGPLLTAPGIDTAGSGWLRLTADKQNQNSFVYYKYPITLKYGLTITFDFVIWTAAGTAADGIAVVLWDGRATPMAGGWGGSLGYAQHSEFGSVGMNGGFTAFGFDTYGNFSNPTEDREGGPGSSTVFSSFARGDGSRSQPGLPISYRCGAPVGFCKFECRDPPHKY